MTADNPDVASANRPRNGGTRREFSLRRTFIVATLGVTIAMGATLAPGAPAAIADEIGLSGVPANSDGIADSRSRFNYTADPGEQFVDHYLVLNTGTQPQTFTVLGADAFNDDAGAYALKPTEELPTDIGSWVLFENGESRIQFELQPAESRLVPFTLAVPENATPGDHAGGIVVSVVSPDGQVRVDRRVGTRTYVRVSGDIHIGLSVSKLDGEYSGEWWNPFAGTLTTRYTVENTGNIALASNVSLGLKTWFGIPLENTVGDGIPELLPGGTRVYETEVSGVAAWGLLNPWVELNPFVEGDDPAKRLVTQPTSRDAFVLAMPWMVVIIIGLVGLFIAFTVWRRKVDAKRAAAWMAYTEAEAANKAAAEKNGREAANEERS